jgi:hypothetical protein
MTRDQAFQTAQMFRDLGASAYAEENQRVIDHQVVSYWTISASLVDARHGVSGDSGRIEEPLDAQAARALVGTMRAEIKRRIASVRASRQTQRELDAE